MKARIFMLALSILPELIKIVVDLVIGKKYKVEDLEEKTGKLSKIYGEWEKWGKR